jgi:alkylation response protein AidB-like acyl-CoA dehydrogenase
MYIGYTSEHEALRDELRSYYDGLLTPEIRAEVSRSEGVGPAVRAVVRQMAADGWLGIGWPEEYGGQGRGFLEQFIFFDESMRAGAPVPMLTINSVAPTLMIHGSQEQKDFYLPRILRGEIHFCIGYTEPDAGTDLASLRTSAVRDGDEYVINGQKIFTSLATDADYVWLACRTNPEEKKHKGISMIIVPTDTPGFKAQPIRNFGNFNTNYTFYEDVRVPVANLVGEENQGWRLIVEQLNHERVTICSAGIMERALTDVREWAQQTTIPGSGGGGGTGGQRVIDQPWVQHNLAWVHAHLDVLRLLNWKVAWKAEQGAHLDPADASSVKVFGTEFYMEGLRRLLEVMGARATVRGGSPDAVVGGRVADALRGLHVLTFGGGTNEMQRDLIALFGLGMPPSPR